MELVTRFIRNNDYSAYLVFGCGVIIAESNFAAKCLKFQEYKKIRKMFGYDVSFQFIGFEV